jgi:putative transposase
MLKAYKYRLYPNKKQEVLFSKAFGCVRFVWNKHVEAFNNKEVVDRNSVELKKEFEFLKEVSAAVLQQKEKDFQQFKRQFFNKTRKDKVGRPSFKSRRDKQSFRLPNQKFTVQENRIRLEKIGLVKFVADRVYKGREMNITVSRDRCGDYFASILVDQEDYKPSPKTNKVVGIDLGIKSLVTTSEGTMFSMMSDNQRRVKHTQRRLANKHKGSSRFKKLKLRLAKLHRQDARRREWLIHGVTSFLVKSYDTIVCEDLNTQGMMANHKLAGAIQRQCWGAIVGQLDYKSKWLGRNLVKIDRFFPSSKTCSVCGKVKQELKLSERIFRCECGAEIDRDLNAAINIKTVGVNTVSQSGMGHKTKAKPKDFAKANSSEQTIFLQ